ncbi:SET domain-containing protein/YDG_SRA domain-containing protein/Pre-SET domain-containing protein [Cephalotus follicularis]|uniref:SET domain-containing protein/YDG_SRA domain-containing protein/Pre-SET domain-containing protein n=1 Tax=Cephalotus follicularis TaxID=3775 RepID=A0A1Q3BQV8_CEPFO|nr:SET domain-containing protein/YDG_SRA domain-containing protein/Pre-SET domain-containing protein [Cephalotus follicularis]
MGSLFPFQDLNQLPDPFNTTTTTTTTAATTTMMVLKTPKLEPKQEPLDSLPPEPEQEQLFFSDSTPHTAFPLSENTPLSIPSGEDNLYSEFNRISDLFRTAFAKRLHQQYDDVEVVGPEDSRAIVPVPEETHISSVDETHISNVVVSRRKYQPRSSELVRVTDLSLEDQRYFRDVVRRTRMVYDSLRILSVVEEERRRGPGLGRRSRGDLRAASVMRDRNLWLNRDKRIVGSIPGVEVGDLFFFRMELCVMGLHGQPQAGIDYLPGSQSSNGEPIATSIIVSGGYEDDEDAGDVIIYTGHGGQDKFNRQCMHQKLEGGNRALERSMHYGIEVRVIRGIKYEGGVSSKVYVYDGLYKIHDCWFDVGKSGFGVYKYKLVRMDGQPEMGSTILRFAEGLRTRLMTLRPTGYLSLDISRKKENVPVLLFNDIDNDNEPMYYEYLARSVFPPFVFDQVSSRSGCECVEGCSDGCFCAMKNGGEFAYDPNGSLLRGKPVIFECGTFCNCPPCCPNRVTQKGLKNKLEVFRSRETGWGVRSLNLIHAGAFICEYAGVVLTREQAEVFTMNGDTLIYPNRFSAKWAEWGDLSQIFSDYVCPSYPSIPPLDFAMDVSRLRNVACYISHSSSPNVLGSFPSVTEYA